MPTPLIAIARTSLLGTLFCGLAFVVYWRLSDDDLRRTIMEMETMQLEMQQRLEAKEGMIRRLNRSRRLAHIQVLDQQRTPDGTVQMTDLLFIELDDEGGELARQQFTLPGDVLFVDAWSVKFHHEDVAEGHPLRGRTLILLRRIYSDRMAPLDGYPIDVPGAIPPGYAAGEAAEFEVRVWKFFWEIATDPEAAAAHGVRVAQGEVVYKPVRTGQVFELSVDAIGGMSLVPLPTNDIASVDEQ